MEGAGQAPAASSSPFAAPAAAPSSSDVALMRAAMLAAQATAEIDAVLGSTELGPSGDSGSQDASGPPAPVASALPADDAMDLSDDLSSQTAFAASGQAPAQAPAQASMAQVSAAVAAAAAAAAHAGAVGEKRLREGEQPAGSPPTKVARPEEVSRGAAGLTPPAAAAVAPAPGTPTAGASGAVQNLSPFVTEAEIIESHRQLGLYAGFESPAKLKQVAEAIVAPDLIPTSKIPENINTLRGPGGRFASKTPKEETAVETPKRRRKRSGMQNGNQWSEEENLLFLQGLQTFGRKFSRIHSRFFPYRSKQAVVCRFSYLSRVWADCRDASVLAVGHPLRDAYLKILPPMETENFIQRRAENEKRLAMGLPVPAKPTARSPAPIAAPETKSPRVKKVKREKRTQKKKLKEVIPPRRTSSGRLRKRPARLKDHTDSDGDVSEYDDDDDETFHIADGVDSETDSDSDCYSPGNDVDEVTTKQPVAVPAAVAKALEQKLMSRPSLSDSAETAGYDEAMPDADAAAAAQVLAGVAPSAEDLAVAAVLAAPSSAQPSTSAPGPSEADIEAVAQALMKGPEVVVDRSTAADTVTATSAASATATTTATATATAEPYPAPFEPKSTSPPVAMPQTQ